MNSRLATTQLYIDKFVNSIDYQALVQERMYRTSQNYRPLCTGSKKIYFVVSKCFDLYSVYV